MSILECPFCGTRLASSYTRCPRCYKSLMLYLPEPDARTQESRAPVRTGSALGHAVWVVGLGVPILVMALLFLLVWS